jgi:hypothetical protein
MTKARQEATLKKIERSVKKLLPQQDDDRVLVTGYEDEMGEDIGDLEESGEDS